MECTNRTKRRCQPQWLQQKQPATTKLPCSDPIEEEAVTAAVVREDTDSPDVQQLSPDQSSLEGSRKQHFQPAASVQSCQPAMLTTSAQPDSRQANNFSAFKGATVTKAQLRVVAKPPYKESDTFVIGGFEGELYTEITYDEFLSGRCFTTGNSCCNLLPTISRAPPPPQSSPLPQPRSQAARVVSDGLEDVEMKKAREHPPLTCNAVQASSHAVPAEAANELALSIDGFLDQHLRPHQRDGLTWMHERIADGGGCILADSMGLGKTLQAAALLWTLMTGQTKRQNSAAYKAVVTLACSTRNQTLIVSYEDIRRVEIACAVDLLICDEGHRLRSLRSQTFVHLQKIRSKRRLLLTGMSSCSQHKTRISLRSNVFPTSRIVNTPEAFGAKQTDMAALVKASLQGDGEAVFQQPNKQLRTGEPAEVHPGLKEPSNKLAVLMHIMIQLQKGSPEKVVVVSNSTAVLDRVEELFKKHAWLSLRLDGSTPESARTKLVEKFNKDPTIQAFLLSSKAGGIGLNLTGASRLIHFDPDWNPANDQQALSRIWRDGQTKPVFIYRLMGAGTVEGHIIRRQIFKNSLAKANGREGSSGDIMTSHTGADDQADGGCELVECFVPGCSPLPLWLEGFHLHEPSSLLRRIELEEDTGRMEDPAPLQTEIEKTI
ncbi:hypothetical protein Efla_005165 [Eimeria flavescens]